MPLKADVICSAKSLWRQPWLLPIGSSWRRRPPGCRRKWATAFAFGLSIRRCDSLSRDDRGGRLLSLSLTRQSSRPEYTVDDWANQEQRSGGAALDLHIHDTDFVLALLGPPCGVYSRSTFDNSGPSHIFTLYEYPHVVVVRRRLELSGQVGISDGIPGPF